MAVLLQKALYTFHNQNVYENLKRGDLIEFDRGLYSHWGVYVGNGDVVHLTGEEDDGFNGASQAENLFTISGVVYNKALVCKQNFWTVVQNEMANIRNDKDSQWSSLNPDYIVQRALASIGEVGYNVLYKNCEHFAKWCRYNIAESEQVENVMVAGAVLLGIGAAAAATNCLFRLFDSTEPEKKTKK